MSDKSFIIETDKNIFLFNGSEEIIYALELYGKQYQYEIKEGKDDAYTLVIKFPHNDENGNVQYYTHNDINIDPTKTTNFNIQIRDIVKGFKEKDIIRTFDLNIIPNSVITDVRNIMNDKVIDLLDKTKKGLTDEEREILRTKEFIKIFNKSLIKKDNFETEFIPKEELTELKRMFIIITGAFLTYAKAIESTAEKDNKD